MRSFFIIVLVLTILNTSCSKSGVPFQPGGTLTAAQRRNLVAIHPGFSGWNPSQSALWDHRGIARHVFIQKGGIGSLTMPYAVVVFDDDEKVVEANIVMAPNPATPTTFSGVSPVRVTFVRPDGKSVECAGKYSSATWQVELRKRMELQLNIQKIFEPMQHRTGITNAELIDQMMQKAIRISTNGS